MRFRVPVDRGAMAHGIDVPVLVLEFELLLLFRQQSRIDSWIFEEFAGFHEALDTCLEQRFFDPLPRPFRAVAQPLPIEQCDGQDGAVPMRPRANVDAGAAFPDRCVHRIGYPPGQAVSSPAGL